jgi:hypothetical protein
MIELIAFLGLVCLQLGVEVIRQAAFALPVAYVWEFEKHALWWREGEDPAYLEVPLLITGLAAGSISVLTWPHGDVVSYPLNTIAALASPLITGGFMYKTGLLFRELGKQPPSMFAVRDATIFAVGISMMRILAAGSPPVS